jgi:hypothetical protein
MIRRTLQLWYVYICFVSTSESIRVGKGLEKSLLGIHEIAEADASGFNDAATWVFFLS